MKKLILLLLLIPYLAFAGSTLRSDQVDIIADLNDGHTIQDEGSDLAERNNLNFTGAGIVCTDDSANDQTDCGLTANVPLLDVSNVFTGSIQEFSSVAPRLDFRDTNQGLNLKIFAISSNAQEFRIITFNDDGSGGSTVVAWSRTGSQVFGTIPLARLDGFSGSKTVDIGSITGGLSTSTDITVTGVALGDFVLVSSSIAINTSIVLTARIKAADTVEVIFANISAGAINPANATYFVRIVKKDF